ncbi:hypothetical protein SAMD00019534_105350 [Acytostelium subglobosum LB1]|uniref:hypothetical protein n=1 Tax=Acytostelium subglobosum LB1 TaxID=1410327 RepID=UPI0006449627|nr:hypothetical protein SAMD00019534_105350 [Acytostelium subglobosum LB1]GAM27360.1 hypothetical protein SAMD00019534_105350 [Acytostelium subglobosum LB1]|eukprot:XP_012749827.1 hypothetical protein SAMD00019534_105350 [Acytostelium subglobosum LB1]
MSKSVGSLLSSTTNGGQSLALMELPSYISVTPKISLTDIIRSYEEASNKTRSRKGPYTRPVDGVDPSISSNDESDNINIGNINNNKSNGRGSLGNNKTSSTKNTSQLSKSFAGFNSNSSSNSSSSSSSSKSDTIFSHRSSLTSSMGDLTIEHFSHLDRPFFTTVPIDTDVYSCPVWGCAFIFQKYKDIEIHCQLHHPSRLTNSIESRGVDIVAHNEITDVMLLDRYSAGSIPLLVSGLPDQWASSAADFNVNTLLQRYPKNKTMWNYADETGRNHQYIGDFNKFNQSTSRTARNSCCVKMAFDHPDSWGPLPFFKSNYLNILRDSHFPKSYLFIGGSGSIISLHRQFTDFSIIALQGMMRVILFPPNKIVEMGAFNKHLLNKDGNMPRYIYFEPQLTQDDTALISRFGGRVVFVHKEETLFIPAGWYFQTTILEDDSLSLHYQSVNQNNLEFFLQNIKKQGLGDNFTAFDFTRCIIGDFLKRATQLIANQKKNKNSPVILEPTRKQWNNFQCSAKQMSLYQHVIAALKECFTLISAYYLVMQDKPLEEKIRIEQEQLVNNLKKASNDLNYCLIAMSSFYVNQ